MSEPTAEQSQEVAAPQLPRTSLRLLPIGGHCCGRESVLSTPTSPPSLELLAWCSSRRGCQTAPGSWSPPRSAGAPLDALTLGLDGSRTVLLEGEWAWLTHPLVSHDGCNLTYAATPFQGNVWSMEPRGGPRRWPGPLLRIPRQASSDLLLDFAGIDEHNSDSP